MKPNLSSVARGRELVELGLAGIGVQQDTDRPFRFLEETGQLRDLEPCTGQASERRIITPAGGDQELLEPSLCLQGDAGRLGIDAGAEIATGHRAAGGSAVAPDLDRHGIARTEDNLQVGALVQSDPVVLQEHVPPLQAVFRGIGAGNDDGHQQAMLGQRLGRRRGPLVEHRIAQRQQPHIGVGVRLLAQVRQNRGRGGVTDRPGVSRP